MNLLIYAHLHNLRNGTGTGRFASEVIRGLASDDEQQVVVIGEASEIIRANFDKDSEWRNISFRGFEGSFRQKQLSWIAMERPYIERLWHDAHVVYSPAEAYVATRKPYAVTIHDAAYFDLNAHRQNLAFVKQSLKWRLLFSKISRRVDLIHTVSNFSAERLAHHFPGMANRIHVVPNGVSSFFFDCQGEERRDRFVHVPGGLSYRKNADLIIAAWRLYTEYDDRTSLIVTGRCEPEYARSLKSAGARVQLLGYVEDAQLRSIYQRASVVWFPSRYEGFGIPVLEAMACGAPVLTSTAAALMEVAGDAAVLQPCDSPEAHSNSLKALLMDQDLSKDLSARGRARAEGYRWSQTTRQLQTLFSEKLA
jgi:glycosyltransferase involved in cell wall biosynthesis